jgi:uncharacterized protein (DUF169 family)
MRPLNQDLSIYEKFNFENSPLAVKFEFTRPSNMEQFKGTLSMCEIIREAQKSVNPFYMTKDNEDCFGAFAMGMKKAPSFLETGKLGYMLEVYQDPRANQKIYPHISKFEHGTVNYVAFSRLDKLTFEPDVLLLMATVSQADIIMRAMSYSTGEVWSTMSTPVLGCSWILTYPFNSGKVNYIVTGMTHGMKARKVFPDGMFLIAIPYNLDTGNNTEPERNEMDSAGLYRRSRKSHRKGKKNHRADGERSRITLVLIISSCISV